MKRGTVYFAMFALAVSAGCVRLGFWQVSRLGERRERNAQVMQRLVQAPVELSRVPTDSTRRFRRATAEGRYDYENEFVLASRSRLGSPGVHILTPLRIGDGNRTVLVNRGWVYAPDGMRVDLAPWREPELARVDGWVEEFVIASGPVETPSNARAVRRMDFDSVQARLPYALMPFVIVQQRDSGVAAAAAAGIPVRAEPPPLSEGSHRAYAVQWFGFALVGIAGAGLVLARERNRGAGGAGGGSSGAGGGRGETERRVRGRIRRPGDDPSARRQVVSGERLP